MLEGQEPRPCPRCEDGSMRSGGYVELVVSPEPRRWGSRVALGSVVAFTSWRSASCVRCDGAESTSGMIGDCRVGMDRNRGVVGIWPYGQLLEPNCLPGSRVFESKPESLASSKVSREVISRCGGNQGY